MAHPDGPDAEYMLSDDPLGPPPDWLIADLVERATKKVRAPKEPKAPSGNGKVNPTAVAKYGAVALEAEVAKVAAAPEGERNSTLWKASCALGSIAGAGAVDREVAEEKLIEATTLPEAEAVDVVRRGLDRGAEAPRDLGHVGKNGDGFERPTIEITVEEHEVNDAAIAALSADPDLYQRGNLLVRVLREEPRPDNMDTGRDPGSLAITTIHAATLRERLTRHACWVKRKKGEDGEPQLVPAHPPDWSVQAVANRGTWRGIRPLEGVTEVPLLRADGTVLETPGYDRRSGILYTPEIEYPKVPESPTREDVQAAVQKLYDLVVDFPFKDGNHKAAWLSALLTAFARPTLPGPAPLFLFDANTSGAGKTFLADIISIVGIGRQRGPDHPPLQRGGDGQVHSRHGGARGQDGPLRQHGDGVRHRRTRPRRGVDRDDPLGPTLGGHQVDGGHPLQPPLRGHRQQRRLEGRHPAAHRRVPPGIARRAPRRAGRLRDPQPARARPGTPGVAGGGRIDDSPGIHRRR